MSLCISCDFGRAARLHELERGFKCDFSDFLAFLTFLTSYLKIEKSSQNSLIEVNHKNRIARIVLGACFEQQKRP